MVTGFSISAGVRQGCPLSPLLFSIVSDVLLRRITRLSPRSLLRAYADDIAMVIRDATLELNTLETIFFEYGRLSGLRLHQGKSVYIPLSIKNIEDARRDILAHAPSWSNFSVTRRAIYLGFMLGPERGDASWDKAFGKMIERSKIWRDIGGGMLITLCAFRTYILPLASFLLQLENLPASWSTTEHKICTMLFPGPRGWMTTHALGSLKELGFPMELVDAKTVSVASKCRVHRWENIAAGGLLINRRFRALKAKIASTDQLARKATWVDWWGRSFLKNLFDAQRELAAVAHSKGNTIEQVLLKSGEEETPKTEWQKKCSILLRVPRSSQMFTHLRRVLDKWQMSTLPGHRVARAVSVLNGISNAVSPKIWAATLRTQCSGWTTHHRMQRSAPCLFGCTHGEDSISHYARCSKLALLMKNKLGIHPPTNGAYLDHFLLLEPPFELSRKTIFARRALGVYAAFMACNKVRKGQATNACETWTQYFKEGASSHKGLADDIRALWDHTPPLPSS